MHVGPCFCGQVDATADCNVQQCGNFDFYMIVEGRNSLTGEKITAGNLPLLPVQHRLQIPARVQTLPALMATTVKPAV